MTSVAGGPALTALYTDKVLASELRVDDSLALVGLTALPIAFILLALALRRFGRYELERTGSAPTTAQTEPVK